MVANLYQRFQQPDLGDVNMFPFWVALDQPWLAYMSGNLVDVLDEDETAEWQIAHDQVERDGTYIFAYPHHCAIGTVPAR